MRFSVKTIKNKNFFKVNILGRHSFTPCCKKLSPYFCIIYNIFLVLIKYRTFTWEIIWLFFLLLCNNVHHRHSLTSLMQIVGVGVLNDDPVNQYKNNFIFHVVSHHLSYFFPGITFFFGIIQNP